MYFGLPRFVRRFLPAEFRWNLPAQGAVYLTFDDGPTPGVTEWVLDQLDRFNAKATFFCLGKNVELHPELFAQLRTRGHAVGNHSYSHQKGWGMPTGRYLEDADLANALIHSNLYRPPYGRIKKSQARRLSERYHIIMWDVLSRDYSQVISPKACLRNVTRQLHDGAIIVFHDSNKSWKNLRYALPRALEEIRRRGLRCDAIEL